MPSLIIKNSYLKGGSSNAAHLSNLVNYVATRDGVQFVYKNQNAKVTTKQKELIKNIIRDFPNSKNSFEYEDYKRTQTVSNASDFIATALEQNLDKLGKRENYVDYIASRPNVETLSAHGLFTSGDEQIVLSQAAKEIASHEGNVWIPIISLRREDAMTVGYDNAERWKNMIEGYVPTIAESMKIPIDKFKWYASFHNESHHPHIHMICYSSDTRYGYLNRDGIEKLKSGMVHEIFKEQLFEIYQQKNKNRDELKKVSKKVFRDLKNQVMQSDYTNPELENLITTLNQKLKSTTGKKQYGYLQPKVKTLINDIVDELAKEPAIKNAYDLWQKTQNEVYYSYKDTMPEPLSLSQQKEFKSIKNMIIAEVIDLDIIHDPSPTDDETSSEHEDEFVEEEEPTATDQVSTEQYHIEWNNNYKQAKKYLHGDDENEPNFEKALELFKLESDNKNTLAIFDMARIYADGLGVEIDTNKSDELYTEALFAFNEIERQKPWKYTEYRIGKMHAQGLGTDQNYEVSAHWFTLSANQKYKYAEYSLGGLYYRGQGVEQGYNQAYSLYLCSAKQGFPYAQYEVAKMYRDGIGTEININQSELWFEQAFSGFEKLERESHDDKIQYRLGVMLQKGMGVEIDIPRAKRYFELSAKIGNTFACYSLAKLILDDEKSTTEEVDNAIGYLETAADSGNPFAQYALAKVYLEEKYTEKNIAKALGLLHSSAEQGNEFAKYKLGVLYCKGEDVSKDITKAISYLTEVAEQGNQFAQYQLGKLYLLGKDVERDKETALNWLTLSAEQGNEYAQFFIDNIDKWNNPSVGMSVLRLFGGLSRLFADDTNKNNSSQHIKIDSKQLRKIREKKLAQGHKISGPEQTIQL